MKIPFDTALITGSSRGIGRGVAVKLAQEGVKKIAVHYCTQQQQAEMTAAEVRAAGATAVLVQGDVSDTSVAEGVVEQAAEALGGCDIFIHSVIPSLDKIFDMSLANQHPLAKWQHAMDTQARAFFIGAKAASRFMNRGGRILAISFKTGAQTGGFQPWVGMGSAKAALESISRYFAVAVGQQGITVNTVSPGVCDETTSVGQTPLPVQEALKNWVESGWTPMRRRCTPQDTAGVCALLCSEEAGFVTGQSISVDGGSSLMNPEMPLMLQMPV